MQDQILFKKSWTEIIDNYLSSDTYRDIVLYALGLADGIGEDNPLLNLIKEEIDEYWAEQERIEYIKKIRLEAAKKGGAPKGNKNAQKTTKKQPKFNQKTTKIQPKNNQNFYKQLFDNYAITRTENENNCDLGCLKEKEKEEKDPPLLTTTPKEKEYKEKESVKEVLTYKEKNENQNFDENKNQDTVDILFGDSINSEEETVKAAPPSSAAPPAQLQLDAFAYMEELHTPTRYELFCKKVEEHAPWCYNNLKMVTEKEMYRLLDNYTPPQIIETICNLENRKDLRKKYSSLYRTLLNWLKNNYGKQGAHT